MIKHSKQRECIKAFLMSRTDHPTADIVYMHVKQEFPNISLGTVYRNLTFLSDTGEIARLKVGDGVDHFDANTSKHYHVICNTCGRIKDIDLPDITQLMNKANEAYEGVITAQSIHFYGTCKNCLNTELKTN